MKEDLGPRPAKPPKSKRALAQLPDVWIAEWLASEDISPGDRKKLQAIKDERKAHHPDVKLAFIPSQAGMTPEQFRAFQRIVPNMGATEVHLHGRIEGKPYQVFKKLGVPIEFHTSVGIDGAKEMLRQSTVVIAVPKETTVKAYATLGTWELIGYARNRSMPVKIIMPDGREQ